MTNKLRVLVPFTVLALAGCDPFCKDDFTAREGLLQFSERKAQWQGLGYSSYVLKYSKFCFGCDGAVEITIENGTVQSAVQVSGSGQTQNITDVDLVSFTSVEAVYEYIELLDQSVDFLKIKYDASLGFPEFIEVDPISDRQYCDGSGETVADDQFEYTFEVVLSE